MPRKNRGYKRGEPFRDARLFVIACEGAKREKEYFEALVDGHQKAIVRLLTPKGDKDGQSAPKWVLDRATNYVEEFGLGEYDQLWLVMDTDRWDAGELRKICQTCQETPGWHVALSNPCFEVWLYQHQADLPVSATKSCKELKTALHNLLPGGYKVEVFVSLAKIAIQRTRNADPDHDQDWPVSMVTKVYRLVEAIRAFLN